MTFEPKYQIGQTIYLWDGYNVVDGIIVSAHLVAEVPVSMAIHKPILYSDTVKWYQYVAIVRGKCRIINQDEICTSPREVIKTEQLRLDTVSAIYADGKTE